MDDVNALEQASEPGRVRCSLAFAYVLCFNQPLPPTAARTGRGVVRFAHTEFTLTPAGPLELGPGGELMETFWLDWRDVRRRRSSVLAGLSSPISPGTPGAAAPDHDHNASALESPAPADSPRRIFDDNSGRAAFSAASDEGLVPNPTASGSNAQVRRSLLFFGQIGQNLARFCQGSLRLIAKQRKMKIDPAGQLHGEHHPELVSRVRRSGGSGCRRSGGSQF